MHPSTVIRSLVITAALAVSGCASTETVTTTTAPDGTVTQTVKRAAVDPMDAALADAAAQLMNLQGGFVP